MNVNSRPCVPDGLRVYAIGDVHGRADLLEELYDAIARDAARARGQAGVIVHLGDYVDRGAWSRAVLERLLAPPPGGMARICLKGNHEALMLDFLAGRDHSGLWLANGGIDTLRSYGVSGQGGEGLRRALAARLPAEHHAFLAGLPLSHRVGDYHFCHAGVRPGVPLACQSEADLLWIREEFLDSGADFGAVVVHGHTVTRDPVERANRIGIDTGAYATGRLTCLVLSGRGRAYLTT